MNSMTDDRKLNLDEDASAALARCYRYLLSLDKKSAVEGEDFADPDPSTASAASSLQLDAQEN